MDYVYSPAAGGFFPLAEKEAFEKSDLWPSDGIAVTAGDHDALFPVPVGKNIGLDNGAPCWVDAPAPTKEQQIAAAEAKKQGLLAAANEYMNSQQWPGKAALGRLKGDALTQYGLWLDYLDAVAAVDTQNAPEIAWPIAPDA